MLKNSAAAVAPKSRVSAGQGKALTDSASGSSGGEVAAAAANQAGPTSAPLCVAPAVLNSKGEVSLVAAAAAACASTACSTRFWRLEKNQYCLYWLPGSRSNCETSAEEGG